MAIEIRAGRTDIADTNLNAVDPAVRADDLVVLRRHDTEAPNTDLLLALALLTPVNGQAQSITTGTMRLTFANRGIGGRPETVDSNALSSRAEAARNISVGVLLGSTSDAELNSFGNVSAARTSDTIVGDALPSSLDLTTEISMYASGLHQINISAAGSWVWWAGVYGQPMDDAFDQIWTWIPA